MIPATWVEISTPDPAAAAHVATHAGARLVSAAPIEPTAMTHVLVGAFSVVVQEHRFDTTLSIIGTGDRAYAAAVRRQIAELALAQCELLSPVSDAVVRAYLDAAVGYVSLAEPAGDPGLGAAVHRGLPVAGRAPSRPQGHSSPARRSQPWPPRSQRSSSVLRSAPDAGVRTFLEALFPHHAGEGRGAR